MGLPTAPERVRQIELGLHDPFEEVGSLAQDDGVDVGQGHVGIIEGTEHRLPDQPAEGHVETPGLVVGLAHTDNGTRWHAHDRPSRMHTRFCCRHGPEVAWPKARRPPPKMWSAA